MPTNCSCCCIVGLHCACMYTNAPCVLVQHFSTSKQQQHRIKMCLHTYIHTCLRYMHCANTMTNCLCYYAIEYANEHIRHNVICISNRYQLFTSHTHVLSNTLLSSPECSYNSSYEITPFSCGCRMCCNANCRLTNVLAPMLPHTAASATTSGSCLH
jgi:hypothetical protein